MDRDRTDGRALAAAQAVASEHGVAFEQAVVVHSASNALGLNFHWNWLNNRPVLWTVLVVILLVGGTYYALVQHRRPAHRTAPEGELPESPPVMTA